VAFEKGAWFVILGCLPNRLICVNTLFEKNKNDYLFRQSRLNFNCSSSMSELPIWLKECPMEDVLMLRHQSTDTA
jgi:hypothetical protein